MPLTASGIPLAPFNPLDGRNAMFFEPFSFAEEAIMVDTPKPSDPSLQQYHHTPEQIDVGEGKYRLLAIAVVVGLLGLAAWAAVANHVFG